MSPNTFDAAAVAQARARLLDAWTPQEERIELLRQGIKGMNPVELRQMLKDVAAASHNEAILEYVVRASGYLGTPDALEDVIPYLDHRRPEVAVNATKAMIDLAPEEAVKVCGDWLKRAPSSHAYPVAEVLADRCLAITENLFLELAFSRRQKHRALAIHYLRKLPAADLVPLLLELIRREPKSGVRRLLVKLLGKKATPAHRAKVERLQKELLAKLGDVDTLLERLHGRTGVGKDAEGRDLPQSQASRRLDPREDG